MSFLPTIQLGIGSLSLLASLFACGTPSDAQLKNVFGVDHRIEWERFDGIPANKRAAVGKLLPIGCTAFMVAPSRIATSAHCLADPRSRGSVKFAPFGYEPIEARILEVGSNRVNPFGQEYEDWALLELVSPTSVPPLLLSSEVTAGEHLAVAGYSQDVVGLQVDAQCTVKAHDGGVLFHDCDLMGGASGGPVLRLRANGEAEVVGIQSSHGACNGNRCTIGVSWTRANSNRATPIGFLPDL